MQTKPLLSKFLLLIVLIAAAIGSYALSRFILDPILPAAPGLPPLSRLRLPPQTQNGITATVESYYADALRLVFVVRVEGEAYYLDSLSLTDSQSEELNTGYSLFSPANDSSTFIIDMQPASPLTETRLDGRLSFTVTSSTEGESPVRFHFDLNVPVHPALTLEPGQSFVALNGSAILLDRLVITPSFTQAYLCYTKPTPADWMIGQTATLRVDDQVAGLQSYAILSDPDYFSGDKGGERGWTPPVPKDRCVKVGFPVGAKDPASITLTIPELEQSMPEVIPAEDLETAYERLRTEDIELKWHQEGNGAYPEWKKLPEGMSEQEAYYQFMQALGYYYYGSWTFEIQLDQHAGAQPKFSTSTYGAGTPIPYPSEEPPAVRVDGQIHSFDLNPDGKTIALATSKGLVLYDLDGKQVRTLNETENFFVVDWSPDGTKLAAGGVIMQNADGGRPHLIVWDTAAWELVFEPKLVNDVFSSFGALAWSPDGNFLATSDYDRGLVVFDIKTGEIAFSQMDFLVAPYAISWSPDGSRLVATGDLGNGIRRWRLETNQAVQLYDSRGDAAQQVAWSPDGQRIASTHQNGTVCFWTVETNLCDGFIQAHNSWATALAWSPDASLLATGGSVIRIWDSRTGKQVTAFGQKDGILYTRLQWFDAKTLISLETGYGEESPTVIRFWNPMTGEILLEFQGASGRRWE